MPAVTPYAKSLSGQSEKIFVVPNIAYTAQTTYAAFVAAAAVVEGELGVFLDTGAVRTTALTAGLKFFVAQKRDGAIHKTPIIAFDQTASKVRTAYVAPVGKVISIGYNTTNTASDIGFVFTGASLTNTLTFGIAVRETTPGNQPFPVQEGYATVTSTTANQYDILSAIVSQLNFDYDYEKAAPDPFVIAEIQQSTATTAITVAATLAVTNKSTQIVFNAAPTGAPVVGEYIAIGGTGQSGIVYKITAIAGDTVTYTIDRPFTGATNAALAIANVLKAPFVSGTSKLGVRFTGIASIGGVFNNPTFVVAGSFGLSTAPVLTTTQWLLGSGYGASIVELEGREGKIFEGVGSTINAAFASDYGQPATFGSAALTYDQIFLNYGSYQIPGANPLDIVSEQMERLHICTVVGSTTGSSLQTVFGL